ncbi:MAG: metalloregulator ArsR/SmtB family transcription factor [Eubacteriales bacterium]|nr:metalloregulator ArsR/SmtB family transcription factor [Eubacteriales bacterium]
MGKDLQRCDAFCIHEDIVSTARDNRLQEDMVMELSELFKVLGDGTRINILRALALNEMCVCDIAALLCMSQSAISHQLRTLKNARLVKYRREGKVIYYSLDDEHVERMFNQGIEHIKHR